MAEQVVDLGQPEFRISLDGELEVRADVAKREIDMRLLPWDHQIDTLQGPELFRRGAFEGTDLNKVLLYGPNHEARMGVGPSGLPSLTRVPIGKAIALSEPEDGPHATFRVARTAAGDEALALAADGIVTGVSVEFRQIAGGTDIETRNGRRVRIHRRVALAGVSTTDIPAYGERATVLAVRSEPDQPVTEAETGAEPMATEAAPTVTEAENAPEQIKQLRSVIANNDAMNDRLDKLELRQRQDIIIPGQNARRDPKDMTGQWVKMALRLMSGERVADQEFRVLSELVTSDNLGVVPEAFSNELIGVIDPSRPFLETTRELPTPESGLSLTVPVLVTRPTVAVQAAEKDDIQSSTTSITSTGFDAVTVAGGGDISLQLLKRSSPSYLDLYLRLLAEAYAAEAESLAIATLLDSGVTPGTGYLDAEDLTIGEAWTNAVSVSKTLRPDRIWMSTTAIQNFIDAKASGTNAPLYSNLAADITVGNGAQGFISGLRPVYVPALDGSGADVVIGPSRGFAWAEDGTFTLQVDVPSKAGRDVALVGILWFAPLYPAAFTSYRFAS